MSADLATLATLVADPERVEAVAPGDVPALLGQLEAVRARLWQRLQAAGAPAAAAAPAPGGNGKPDRLLTADEAASRLGVSRRWMYRHADTLPFTRRLDRGTLRFSERGLERWQATRKPS